jgi:hypothetical protein
MTTPPPASPPPFVDGDLIALKTDQHGKVVTVWLRGYEPMSPEDVLEAHGAAGEATVMLEASRAEVAALQVQLRLASIWQVRAWNMRKALVRSEQEAAALRVELAALRARQACLEAAAGAEVSDEH